MLLFKYIWSILINRCFEIIIIDMILQGNIPQNTRVCVCVCVCVCVRVCACVCVNNTDSNNYLSALLTFCTFSPSSCDAFTSVLTSRSEWLSSPSTLFIPFRITFLSTSFASPTLLYTWSRLKMGKETLNLTTKSKGSSLNY